jgi:hypothetical protein
MQNNKIIEFDKRKTKSIIIWIPMIVFQSYLTLTVVMYAFGPWPWPTLNPNLLYAYLFIMQFLLFIGYIFGLKSIPRPYKGIWSTKRLITISLMANLIWIIPTFFMRSGGAIGIGEIAENLFNGLINPSQGYGDKIEASIDLRETSALEYLTQLLSPLLWIMTPLCVYFWNQLHRLERNLFLIAVISNLASWLAIGTNKGIFDFFLMLPFMIIVAQPNYILKMNLIKKIVSFLLLFSLTIILFFQFSNTMKSRGGGDAPTTDYGAMISLNEENWMIKYLPTESQASAGLLISYLSQGYYPLSLALNEPFVFSYGVGNSYYYTGIVQSFTGPDTISDLTYPARLEPSGWSRTGKWHSIYPWIASDISFIGVPIFVFLIGWLLAVLWRDSLIGQNPFAIALLPLIILMIFYFPANNQILAFSETCNAFYFLLIMWVRTRKSVRN